jgi:hypothetical protein
VKGICLMKLLEILAQEISLTRRILGLIARVK